MLATVPHLQYSQLTNGIKIEHALIIIALSYRLNMQRVLDIGLRLTLPQLDRRSCGWVLR